MRKAYAALIGNERMGAPIEVPSRMAPSLREWQLLVGGQFDYLESRVLRTCLRARLNWICSPVFKVTRHLPKRSEVISWT